MSVEVFQPSNQTQPYWAGGIGWSNPNVFAWLGGTHSTDLWGEHHESPGSCPVYGCAHHSSEPESP